MAKYRFDEVLVWQSENEYHSQILHLQVDGPLHEIEVYEAQIPSLIECLIRVYNDMQDEYSLHPSVEREP